MISQPDDSGMDNYPSDSAAPSDTSESPPESIDEQEAADASKTILAPKAALGDMTKVGDECMMRVVADHGDEVELEYSTKEKENKQESMSPDEELDMMDKG
jgi:hypothetical protein